MYVFKMLVVLKISYISGMPEGETDPTLEGCLLPCGSRELNSGLLGRAISS